jgi:hypothetical protein
MSEPQAAPRPAQASEDSAWVTVPTPWPVDELRGFCGDLEMLFRLNPYYYFERWETLGPDRFRAQFENQSNKQKLSVEIERNAGPDAGFTVLYQGSLKRRTLFVPEPATQGSQLTVIDDYAGLSHEEREQRMAEVDKSLLAWGEALRVYFLRLKRWSWIPGWRWYMRRVWAPMKPSSRRIVWLLYLITVAEFFFFLFVLLIWWVEYR